MLKPVHLEANSLCWEIEVCLYLTIREQLRLKQGRGRHNSKLLKLQSKVCRRMTRHILKNRRNNNRMRKIRAHNLRGRWTMLLALENPLTLRNGNALPEIQTQLPQFQLQLKMIQLGLLFFKNLYQIILMGRHTLSLLFLHQPLGIQLAPSPFLPLVSPGAHLHRARGLQVASSITGSGGTAL